MFLRGFFQVLLAGLLAFVALLTSVSQPFDLAGRSLSLRTSTPRIWSGLIKGHSCVGARPSKSYGNSFGRNPGFLAKRPPNWPVSALCQVAHSLRPLSTSDSRVRLDC